MRKKIIKYLLFYLFLLQFSQTVFPQRTAVYRAKLDSIRSEIENYEKLIRREEAKEKDSLTKLANIEKEIFLRKNLVRELNRSIRSVERDIRYTRKEISDLKEELKKGRKLLSERVVHLYKYNRFNEVEAVLLSKSLNQFFTAVKYFRLIAEFDKKRFEEFEKKIIRLDEKTKQLSESLREKTILRDLKSSEEKNLNRRKNNRVTALNRAKRDKDNYLKAKIKSETEAKQINEIIRTLMAAESRVPADMKEFEGVFPKMKGKLDWPVNGKITTKYGREVNPKHKTVTYNKWIDIKANLGDPVKVVAGGKVLSVRWIPSFGPLVIIDHLDGYFTVYSHFSEVFVEIQQTVRPGQVIGRVGDEGSLDGAKLSFFVFKDGVDLNPEEWLRR